MPPFAIVGFEGMWGLAMVTCVLMPVCQMWRVKSGKPGLAKSYENTRATMRVLFGVSEDDDDRRIFLITLLLIFFIGIVSVKTIAVIITLSHSAVHQCITICCYN